MCYDFRCDALSLDDCDGDIHEYLTNNGGKIKLCRRHVAKKVYRSRVARDHNGEPVRVDRKKSS